MEAHGSDLEYLIYRANVLGLQGQYIRDFYLPNQATLNITDTMWVAVPKEDLIRSAADSVPWDR